MLTLLLTLIACSPDPAPGAWPPAVASQEDPTLPVTWSMKAKDGKIAVSWTITNAGTESVWLLDTDFVPVDGGYQRSERIITLPGEEPGLVRLTRGHLRPPEGQAEARPPTARELPPGQSRPGRGALPLPVASWHPVYLLPGLPEAPIRAVLELGVLVGPPPEGVEPFEEGARSVPEGLPLRPPTLAYVTAAQRLVRGAVQDLPSPTAP